jgi:UDP-glucose 4-epimerase
VVFRWFDVLFSGANSIVVVTGGAGFIGSTLVDRLLGRDCRVVVLDDLSNGTVVNLPLTHPGLTLHRVTVGDPGCAAVVDAAVAAATMVVHLASPIGVGLAHAERFSVVQNILQSGMAVIEACRKHRRPMLLTSSSEVYGPGAAHPLAEDEPLRLSISPRWGYAAGKLALEHLAAGLFQEHGVPTWLVRPFNVAGPRQRPETGLVVASFVEAALQGRPLVIHGDGRQTRAFLHVDDVVDALIRIVQCPQLVGRPVNLGGEQALSINEMAALVLQVSGAAVPIVHQPNAQVFGEGFVPALTRIPDLGLLVSCTGWHPTRTATQAIRDCCDARRAQLAAPVAASVGAGG